MTAAATQPCCPPIAEPTLSPGDAERAAGVFKALGHPARVTIVNLLARATGAGVCVCDLTEPTGLSQPTVSHHLKLLRQAGLIEGERRGTWIYYRLVPQALSDIQRALA
ncbi:MAG TPA: metalloregulator ArsR/SmtB family transcription factor [Egibacteraceae bacterium]|nr:metalloregulator ArsR/SmtB family transcription factor [Egibacteraceae bacterium]